MVLTSLTWGLHPQPCPWAQRLHLRTALCLHFLPELCFRCAYARPWTLLMRSWGGLTSQLHFCFACSYGPAWWFLGWPWPADCLPALMLDLPCCCKLAWYLDFCLIPEPSLQFCSGLVEQGPDHWLRNENQLLKTYNYCIAVVVCKCDNVILMNRTLKQMSLGRK